MPFENELFQCPLCGMHAPASRLTEEGPFPLESFLVVGGGSLPLTDEEKETRKGRSFRKGSGKPGFSRTAQVVTDELRALVRQRIAEIGEQEE